MQKPIKFRFLPVVFLIVACLAGWVTARDFSFKTWNTENGLPQNSVQTIAQTPDGYLWIATRDGLARFDGLRFRVFQRSNTPELPTNRLAWLTTDDVGRLWIFPEASPQLVLYENGSFRVFTKGVDYDFDGVPEIWTEGDATIFSANDTDYVYHNGNFTRGPAVPKRREIGIDKNGVIWIDDGANYYSIVGITATPNPRDDPNPLTLGKTAPLTPDIPFGELNERGRLSDTGYARNKDSFWFFIERENGRMLVRFRRGKLDLSNFHEANVLNMLLDRSGNLWMGLLGDGVYRVDARSMLSDDITHLEIDHIRSGEGLADNTVTRLFRDRDRNVWIGGYKGIQLLQDNPIVSLISHRDGVPSDNVYAVTQDPKGSIWFGAWGVPGWVVRYDSGRVESFESTLTTAITFDSLGNPTFGANGRLWKLKGGRAEQLLIPGFAASEYNLRANGFPIIPGSPKISERPVNEISFVDSDSSGSLWIGGSEGLLRYRDGQTKRFTSADGLPSNSLVAFLQTKSGQIWIGTTSGLARLDGDHFTSFGKADGLGGDFVRSLYEDNDGVLWIGSYDSGIIRYKDGQFRTIDKKDGLFSDGVFCILEDDDGWLWMNSNQGIHRALRQDLNDFADGRITTFISAGYGVEDGLQNVEGNGGKQPAGLRSTDGRLWFPTAGGLAVVDPKRVHRDEQAPNVLIEEVKVDQKEVSNSTDKVVLAPGQTALEINYTGIKFNNAERIRFRYRLEGLDVNWVEAGTRRTAYFSHLPFGDYTFRVLAANRDGVWSEQGAAIHVVIERPYYRTYWFYAIVAFFVAAFIALIYFARVKQLSSIAEARELYARQLLESQERERSRLAMELHDSLGQSLVVIRNRALLGLSKGKDGEAMFAQLQEISDASATALQETREIAHTLHPYQIEALGLTTALHSLIDKFANSSEINFTVEVDPLTELPHDLSIAVYRIAQEWLTNVAKHSSANDVSVELHLQDRQLVLDIKDNGVGFDLRTVKKGLGLKGIEERARMINGLLSVSSNPGSGSEMQLKVTVP